MTDTALRNAERAYWREYRSWRLACLRAGQDSPVLIPFEVGDLIEVTLRSLFWVEGRKRREAGEVFLARVEHVEHLIWKDKTHSRIIWIKAEDDVGDSATIWCGHFQADFRLLEPV